MYLHPEIPLTPSFAHKQFDVFKKSIQAEEDKNHPSKSKIRSDTLTTFPQTLVRLFIFICPYSVLDPEVVSAYHSRNYIIDSFKYLKLFSTFSHYYNLK